MFKKTKHPDFIVGHRLGGNHASRDPLMDEKLGGNKRSRVEDGSSSVVYKETVEERKARLKAEKQAEKELRKAEKEGREAKLSALSRPEASDNAPAGPAKVAKSSSMGALAKLKEAQSKLSTFKDRLKASSLPDAAAAAESKHKEDLAEETAKALAKSSSSAAQPEGSTPDSDERLSMNDIWKAGEAEDDEGSANWLGGQGLKFHTTADKAFSMAAKRFKESVECHDPLENREAAADLAKKRSELRMAEMRRQQKG